MNTSAFIAEVSKALSIPLPIIQKMKPEFERFNWCSMDMAVLLTPNDYWRTRQAIQKIKAQLNFENFIK